MSVEAKDILFRDDLEPGFDENAVLAEMQALAEGASEWRDHIPYAAARCYHEDADILTQYAEHVEKCHYCQRLIDAVHPSDRLIGDLQNMRRRVLDDEPEDTHDSSAAGMWRPLPIAAALLMGILGTSMFTANSPTETAAGDREALMAFLSDPEQLRVLEASDEPVAKFRAARIYLATDNPEVAYQRIGEGFVLASVSDNLVQTVSGVRAIPSNPDGELADIAREAMILTKEDELNEVDLLRLVQLRAQLGQHQEAMASMRDFLNEQENSTQVVRALEASALVEP